MPPLAPALGIDVAALTRSAAVKVASGQTILCKLTTIILGLRRGGTAVYWHCELAIPTVPVPYCYWGFKGFLEYFRADFDGPNRVVTLTAGSNLPAAAPPP
jgi:hypothetical protein